MLSAGQFKCDCLHKSPFCATISIWQALIYQQRLTFGQDTDQGPFLEPSYASYQSVPGDINAGGQSVARGPNATLKAKFWVALRLNSARLKSSKTNTSL